MNYEIIPGILEANQKKFNHKFETAAKFANTIQIDLIDKEFADKDINPALEITQQHPQIKLELHLMTQTPEKKIKKCNKKNIKRAIGHVELMNDVLAFITWVKKQKMEPFLAIDLPTPIEPFLKDEYISAGLKGFTIMTVKAGASGQEFQKEALQKAAHARQKWKDIDIEIDGGVTEHTISIALNAGVNMFAATSAIFKQNPQKEFETLTNILKKYKNQPVNS